MSTSSKLTNVTISPPKPSSSSAPIFSSTNASPSSSSLLSASTAPLASFTTSSSSAATSIGGAANRIAANAPSSISSANFRKFLVFAALSGLSAVALLWAYKRYCKQHRPTLLSEANEKTVAEEEEAPLDPSSINRQPEQQQQPEISEKMAAEETTHQPTGKAAATACSGEECSIVVENCEKAESTELTPPFSEYTQRSAFNWAEEVEKEISSKMSNASITDKNESQTTLDDKQQQTNLSQQQTSTGKQQSSGHSPRGYKNAESPSTHSEGSADSGRATGGLTSTSPFDVEATPTTATTATAMPGMMIPYYEFEIPNSLVGLIIGVGGKTIKELCSRTGVKMLIRPHHTLAKLDTHQICSVEGKRENINKCLHMIKGRFPKERFPDLNLKPVIPPVMPPMVAQFRQQPMPLTLPVGVPCEVFISSTVDPGHFFVQLPTHPSFCSLQILDCFMLQCYGPGGTLELPRPVNPGIMCAAPAYNGWFRALTMYSYPDQDEVLVKFVDYGGYARLPAADLRQIRTDFLTFPMQAIECNLAYVEPADGTAHWSEEANEVFQKMCGARIIQADIVGYTKTPDRTPYVVLYFVDEEKKVQRIDNVLLDKGLAKMADPTRMEVNTRQSSSTSNLNARRNSVNESAAAKAHEKSVEDSGNSQTAEQQQQ